MKCHLSLKKGINLSLVLVAGLVTGSTLFAHNKDVVALLHEVESHAGDHHHEIAEYRKDVQHALCAFVDKKNNESKNAHIQKIDMHVQKLLVLMQRCNTKGKAILEKLYKDLCAIILILKDSNSSLVLGTKLAQYKELLPSCISKKSALELLGCINHRLKC